jgi:mono/diheme cytochrome c family protein
MVCALILCAGGWTAPAQTPGQSFAGTCAGCHGLDGQGSERGPNIATRPEVRGRSDAQLLAILRNGIPMTGMPNFSTLGELKLQALVKYLRTLQGRRDALPIPGDPRRGAALFFGRAQCSQCHMIEGVGGFIGSDLSAYAADYLPEEIRHAILNARDANGGAATVLVTLTDGKVWNGVVRNEDNFSMARFICSRSRRLPP